MKKNNKESSIRSINKDIKNNVVFVISILITGAIVLCGMLNSKGFSEISNNIYLFLQDHFSWFYLLVTFCLVIFCIYMGFSKFGNIKLGSDDCEPEYSTFSWFAMLFCAGMGVGLVFWSIAEPIAHYIQPMEGITPMSKEAMNFSIKSCFMHWGVHPWSLYAIIGLGLAYFQYNRNKPVLISSLFEPLIGTGKKGKVIGNIIDIFSVVLTVIGVATSLGMACIQICQGLNYLFGIDVNVKLWVIMIVVIACAYIYSSLTGIDKGVKFLSNANLSLSIGLLVVAFCVGPIDTTLNSIVNGLGEYISGFVIDSLKINPYGDKTWIYGWRVFYWAWWITWAPFTGVFIARISKGRTIREFIMGVILVPSIACMVWFGVFGNLALNVADLFDVQTLSQMVSTPETALYFIFSKYPLGNVLSIISIIVLTIFFITSADSATFVVSMMSSNGELNPSNYKKFLWGVILALLAIILLITGGLESIKTMSVATSFPFLFILIAICFSIKKALTCDLKIKKSSEDMNKKTS